MLLCQARLPLNKLYVLMSIYKGLGRVHHETVQNLDSDVVAVRIWNEDMEITRRPPKKEGVEEH